MRVEVSTNKRFSKALQPPMALITTTGRSVHSMSFAAGKAALSRLRNPSLGTWRSAEAEVGGWGVGVERGNAGESAHMGGDGASEADDGAH